jgi:hypothetical protein
MQMDLPQAKPSSALLTAFRRPIPNPLTSEDLSSGD